MRRGEILGIGGLAGHGKVGIANGVMGLYPSTGRVFTNGSELRLNDPKGALESGMAFVSEDRRGVGLLLDESIEMNIALTAMQVQGQFLRPGGFSALRLADEAGIREHALEVIEDLDIRCTGPEQLVRRLSGEISRRFAWGERSPCILRFCGFPSPRGDRCRAKQPFWISWSTSTANMG